MKREALSIHWRSAWWPLARVGDPPQAARRAAAPAMAAARAYVRSRAVAEEVVQDAWLGVLRGLDRFEGRSSLRRWVLQIVANIARTRAVREARTMPFSAFELDIGEPAVDPARFDGP